MEKEQQTPEFSLTPPPSPPVIEEPVLQAPSSPEVTRTDKPIIEASPAKQDETVVRGGPIDISEEEKKRADEKRKQLQEEQNRLNRPYPTIAVRSFSDCLKACSAGFQAGADKGEVHAFIVGRTGRQVVATTHSALKTLASKRKMNVVVKGEKQAEALTPEASKEMPVPETVTKSDVDLARENITKAVERAKARGLTTPEKEPRQKETRKKKEKEVER